MIKALLIHPPSPVINGSPPLSLAYLGAVLERKGCLVRIIDAAAPYARYNIEDIKEEARQFKPDLIAITMSTTFVKFAYQLTNALSEIPSLIIAGGPHPTMLAEEVLGHNVDIAIKGEGEEVISEIVNFIEGKTDLKSIAGICYLDTSKRIIHTSFRRPIKILEELPFPAKYLFKHSDYVKSDYEFIRYGNIITSRGCPYKCIFFSSKILGTEFRYRTPKNIIEEIRFIQDQYGVEMFFFLDDVFTFDHKRVNEFCKLARGLSKPINWTCITRIDLINPELLKEMKEAGCYSITYGIETGSQQTLKLIEKKIDLDRVEQCINLTKYFKIKPHASFMFGFPWEEVCDIKRTRSLLKSIAPNLTYIVNGGILIPYPGTEIYNRYKDTYSNIKEWWLKIDLRWWGYSKIKDKPLLPLFERLFFKDYYILKANFFNYSDVMILEIKKITDFIGRFNLYMYSKRLTNRPMLLYFYKSMLFLTVKLSKLIHRINHLLEKRLLIPINHIIRLNIQRIFIEK